MFKCPDFIAMDPMKKGLHTHPMPPKRHASASRWPLLKANADDKQASHHQIPEATQQHLMT